MTVTTAGEIANKLTIFVRISEEILLPTAFGFVRMTETGVYIFLVSQQISFSLTALAYLRGAVKIHFISRIVTEIAEIKSPLSRIISTGFLSEKYRIMLKTEVSIKLKRRPTVTGRRQISITPARLFLISLFEYRTISLIFINSRP